MKAIIFPAILLLLGLMIDAGPGIERKNMTPENCSKFGAKCTSAECGEDYIIYGWCLDGTTCCKRDPLTFCLDRGGYCSRPTCKKRSDIFLGFCAKNLKCCRRSKIIGTSII